MTSNAESGWSDRSGAVGMRRARARFLFLIVGAILGFVISYGLLTEIGQAGTQLSTFRSADEQRQIDVYKRTNESVVFITTISLAVDPSEAFFSVRPQEGTGSGVIVDAKRGIILTNSHVIQDAQQIEVAFANGETSPAKRLGADVESDLAVIQVERTPEGLSSLQFGDSSKLEVGQHVLAIGNPFGLNRTLTSGIISSLDRSVRVSDKHLMKGLIQTDAAINPGNSGGPLLDMDGQMIGLNSAILSSSGSSAGIGFSVPINQIKRLLSDLVTKGRVLRPRIGWSLIDTNQGPFVERVLAQSPADQAGIQPVLRRVQQAFLQMFVKDFSRADLIYAVNGRRVQSRDEVDDIVSEAAPEQPITFTLRRGGLSGRSREVQITPVLQ